MRFAAAPPPADGAGGTIAAASAAAATVAAALKNEYGLDVSAAPPPSAGIAPIRQSRSHVTLADALASPPLQTADAGAGRFNSIMTAGSGGFGTGLLPPDARKNVSSTPHLSKSLRRGKMVLAMVGLPARGKTYIARKLAHHLQWMGHKTTTFNVGNYRRKILGASQSHDFFDPTNAEGMKLRRAMANEALNDMIEVCVCVCGCPTRTPRARPLTPLLTRGAAVLCCAVLCCAAACALELCRR
jgi:hypothetical protein